MGLGLGMVMVVVVGVGVGWVVVSGVGWGMGLDVCCRVGVACGVVEWWSAGVPLVGFCGGVAWGGVVLVLLEVPCVIVPLVSPKLLNQIVLQPLFVQSVRELRHRCPLCRQRLFVVVSPPASELPDGEPPSKQASERAIRRGGRRTNHPLVGRLAGWPGSAWWPWPPWPWNRCITGQASNSR